jgi:hypothetical protein
MIIDSLDPVSNSEAHVDTKPLHLGAHPLTTEKLNEYIALDDMGPEDAMFERRFE